MTNDNDAILPARPTVSAVTRPETILLSEIMVEHTAGRELLPGDFVMSLVSAVVKDLAIVHQAGGTYGTITPADIELSEARGFRLVSPRRDRAAMAPAEIQTRATYVAPEFSEGTWIPASDIFSAGITLWQCLLGLHPFIYREGERLTETIRHIVHDPPLLPAGMAGRVDDRGLLALATAMLAKEPSQRPDSETLLRAVGNYDGGDVRQLGRDPDSQTENDGAERS